MQVQVQGREAAQVWVVVCWAQDALAPASGFSEKSRPVVEHIGYTWDHLPRNEDASLAILAARMAFSNREIRPAFR